ncbi:MAG: sulfite exporter TauE/SafE family protein [Candidatus Marinimicrobia bacterium]|nr:sulfite exporter TauE/SafE family protein [Candidatus Neomarinimicrobiota bacterium]
MFNQQLIVLIPTAASIAFLHTILGPDHYIPFVAMARARKWSTQKTMIVTLLAGIGHIIGSVLLGTVGIVFGIAIKRLEIFQSFQGNLAAWLLIIFGLIYFVWGLKRAIKNKPHKHFHLHPNGNGHTHEHIHKDEHTHVHDEQGKQDITPWVLFTIFIFGPCEALIPIFMYTAINNSTFDLIAVTVVFGAITILTMLTVVLAASYGVNFIPITRFEKYTHAITGIIISFLGMGILFLGL